MIKAWKKYNLKQKYEQMTNDLQDIKKKVRDYQYLVYAYTEIGYAIQFKDMDLYYLERDIKELDEKIEQTPGNLKLLVCRNLALEKKTKFLKEREKLETRRCQEQSTYEDNKKVLNDLITQQMSLQESVDTLYYRIHS